MIVLTAAAVGVLMLVGIDNRTLPRRAPTRTPQTINLLNNVVVGMIVLFAAVDRGQRLRGRRRRTAGPSCTGSGCSAPPRSQVEASVLAEAGVVAGVGVVLGLVASLATIVPFGVARHEGVVPDGQLWLPPLRGRGRGRADPASAARSAGPAYGAAGRRRSDDRLDRDVLSSRSGRSGRRRSTGTPSSTGSG